MADTVKTYARLKLVAGFADEDDRTITLENPRNGITKADVDALPAEGVLIGDKYGAAFTRFKSASYVYGSTTDYDLQT